jgi:hypothetical protein
MRAPMNSRGPQADESQGLHKSIKDYVAQNPSLTPLSYLEDDNLLNTRATLEFSQYLNQ